MTHNGTDPSRPAANGLAYRLLRRVIAVEPEEAAVLFWCWLYIFAVLSSYYIMRPIRDQMGVAGGVNNLQWLFTGTLVGMMVLNLPFAWLVKTPAAQPVHSADLPVLRAQHPAVRRASPLCATPSRRSGSAAIFFIWVSVYNLFVVSIFWQLNVDLFSRRAGKTAVRLYRGRRDGRRDRRLGGDREPGAHRCRRWRC